MSSRTELQEEWRRHQRQATLNDIIYRALPLARVPARLEPVGLLRVMGKPLVWDATCVDTYAPSYRSLVLHR